MALSNPLVIEWLRFLSRFATRKVRGETAKGLDATDLLSPGFFIVWLSLAF